MSSSGTVPLKDIWAMLDDCAKGHSRVQKTHNWIVNYAGRTYHRLPVGGHGRRQNPAIQIGHVRSLIRFFEIEPCAKTKIPLLA